MGVLPLSPSNFLLSCVDGCFSVWLGFACLIGDYDGAVACVDAEKLGDLSLYCRGSGLAVVVF